MPPGAPSEEVRGAEQKAMIGLILGICNFVICGILCIPALILGNQALAVLDRPGVQSNSRNMANWARILGIIGIILLVVAVVVWVVIMIVAAVTGAAAAVKSSP
jgi:magnesium-transporting ATPase (P-type)